MVLFGLMGLAACTTTPPSPQQRLLTSELGAPVVVQGRPISFVLRAAEGAVRRLQRFSLRLSSRTRVIIHSDISDFVRATGQTIPSLRAWTTYDEVHLLPPDTWRQHGPLHAEERLAHELCHAAVYQQLGTKAHARSLRLPRFVFEGICSVVAGQEARRAPLALIRQRLVEHSVEDLLGNDAFADDGAIAYGAAHHLFARWFELRGAKALLPLLAELSAGKSVEEALGAAPLELLGIAPAPLNEGCNSASQAE